MYKKIMAAVLAAVMLLCLLSGCSSSGNQVQDARKGVVRVLVLTPTSIGFGSAVGVGKLGEEPTYFVTNRHVVTDENGNMVTNAYILKDSYAVPVMEDGSLDLALLDFSRMVPCTVRYRSPDGSPDLAVIEASDPVSGRTALPFAHAEKALETGDHVYALGYPASADYTSFKEMGGALPGSVEDQTVTDGIVSRIAEAGPMDNTRIIQHTASINPGNSGGALIDSRGVVVGINTKTFNADGVDTHEQNHYAAIESEYVMDMLDDLGIKYVVKDPGLPVAAIVGLAVAAAAVVVFVIAFTTHKGGSEGKKVTDGGNTETGSIGKTSGTGEVTYPSSNGGFRIQGISGVYANRRFSVNGSMRIGRDPSRNDLVYPANTNGISGVHCVLVEDGGSLLLQDLGSKYGTFVAGSRIAASQAMALHKGDRFWLGSEQEAFVVDWKG